MIIHRDFKPGQYVGQGEAYQLKETEPSRTELIHSLYGLANYYRREARRVQRQQPNLTDLARFYERLASQAKRDYEFLRKLDSDYRQALGSYEHQFGKVG